MKFHPSQFKCFAAACLFLAPRTLFADHPVSPPSSGEPYTVAGNRIVFATWRYVRPGSFAWINQSGANVTVAGSEDAFGANLQKRDHPTGIRIVAQPAQRRGPIIKPEKPWEAQGVSLGTILRDGNRFRAWGGCADATGRKYFCYFESDDGVNWKRPEFDFVEFAGSRKNNLLSFTSGTVFNDPSAPAEERYKWVSLETIDHAAFERFRKERPDAWRPDAIRKDVGHVYAIRGAVSPDGLRWQLLPDPLVGEHSDTQVIAYYDERAEKYVMFTRNYSVQPRAMEPGDKEQVVWWGGDAYGIGRRAIGRTESADFRKFPLSKVVLEPGPERLPDDVYYTNCKTTIPGTDQPVLFPAVWHTSNDSTSIELAASDDGLNWHFLFGNPVLDTASYGEWDGGCLFAQPNLLELANGDFALPYTGYNFPHKYPRGQWRFATGYAIWPKGRIIALEATQRGEFATAIILAPGTKLRLNAETKRGGSILVEVADAQGAPISGRSFDNAIATVGDQPSALVKWKANETTGIEKGKPLMLRFRLDQAKLFALMFED
ncbi:MAG: hypothetical protein AAB380_08080 [Verrucomicrobiota bacterium]